MTTQITIAYGDGIGYEIMDAALLIMREAGAQLDVEVVQMGEEEYRLGAPNGFDNRTLRAIKRTGILLKAPTIDPALIDNLDEGEFFSASSALYKELEITTHETNFIFADAPEFTAISSIGENVAIFESALAFDSAPHPAGMIFAACKMLEHIGQNQVGTNITNAILETFKELASTQVDSNKFAQAVIDRLKF